MWYVGKDYGVSPWQMPQGEWIRNPVGQITNSSQSWADLSLCETLRIVHIKTDVL